MISIRVMGDGLDYSLAIADEADIEIVEKLLAKIRRSLQRTGPTFFAAGLPLPSAAEKAYILGETDVPPWGGNKANAPTGDST